MRDEVTTSRRARPGGLCSLVAAVLLLVHFGSFDVVHRPLEKDNRYTAFQAARLVAGDVPHRDYLENRTQLATFVAAGFYALGRACGIDPVAAMRGGFLLIGAVGGLLLFAMYRLLAEERCSGALLGLLPYVGVAFFGVLLADGPFPKSLLAICIPLAALLAFYERWFLAGAAGALAACDWQVGGLVIIAVLVAALRAEDRRLGALLQATGGVAAVSAVGILYLGLNGALGPASRQLIAGAFAPHGESALSPEGMTRRPARILKMISIACPSAEWIVVLGVLGALVFPFWSWRREGLPLRRLLLCAGISYYGIVLFSFVDFQRFGDLYILLQAAVFFAGFLLVVLWGATTRWWEDRRARPMPRAVTVAVLGAVALLARPSILHPEIDLGRNAGLRPTLEDQREVARRIVERFPGRRLGFIGHVEIPLLAEVPNALPFSFWNRATYSYFRSDPSERPEATLARLVRERQIDAVACSQSEGACPVGALGFERVRLKSADGRYGIVLWVRPGSWSSRG